MSDARSKTNPGKSRPRVVLDEGTVEAFARGPAAWRQRLRWYLQHSGHLHDEGVGALMDPTDLELLDAGFLVRSEPRVFSHRMAHYAITPRGEAMAVALLRRQQRLLAPHHQLASTLAHWLVRQGRMTWENSAFSAMGPQGPCEVRPDVFSLLATLNPGRMEPMVHEVKISRADFLADITVPEKRAAYFSLAPRVVYATPAGLLKEGEVPPECGWLEQDGEEWRLRQRARKNTSWKPWDGRVWLALALKPHQTPRGTD